MNRRTGKLLLLFFLNRGGTESTRQATLLINALIKDPDKEIDELIPKNRLKSPAASTKAGVSAQATTTAAFSSGTGSKVTISSSSQVVTTLSVPAGSSASAHKTGKSPVNNVRPGFPVSLPIAYPPPQLAHALLAAQTFQQIRPPRLPMTHFGGTFPAAQSTWGPFPVRPLSPARAPNSPKPHTVPRQNSQNTGGSQVHLAGALTSAPTATTAAAVSPVPGPSPNSSPRSPAVQRQSSVTVAKTASTTTVTTTASSNSTVPTNATYPFPTAKEHHPAPSTPSSSPPIQISKVSSESPVECATNSPSQGPSSSDQEVGSPSATEAPLPASNRQSNGVSAAGTPSGPSAPSHSVGAASQEAKPAPHQPQGPSQDPQMAGPPDLVTVSSSSTPVVPANTSVNFPSPHVSMGPARQPPPPQTESPAVRPPSQGEKPAQKNSAAAQNPAVPVLSISHTKRPHSVPSSAHLPSPGGPQGAAQTPAHPSPKPRAPSFSAALPFGPFTRLFEKSAASTHAFWGGSVISSQMPPEPVVSGKSSFLPNSDVLHPLETSKAPGFRPPLQRQAPDPSGECLPSPSMLHSIKYYFNCNPQHLMYLSFSYIHLSSGLPCTRGQ